MKNKILWVLGYWGERKNVYLISLAGFDRDIRASKQISTKPR